MNISESAKLKIIGVLKKAKIPLSVSDIQRHTFYCLNHTYNITKCLENEKRIKFVLEDIRKRKQGASKEKRYYYETIS